MSTVTKLIGGCIRAVFRRPLRQALVQSMLKVMEEGAVKIDPSVTVPAVPENSEQPDGKDKGGMIGEGIFQWSLPKVGNPPERNEDAAGSRYDPETGRLRLAVADGASTSWYSGEWARLLVEFALRLDTSEPFAWTTQKEWEEGLTEVRRQWREALPPANHALGYLNELARTKTDRGAAACLMLVEIDLPNGAWRAVGYGNCLLVQTTQATVSHCGPYTRPEEYDGFTPLILSTAGFTGKDENFFRAEGRCQVGDEFYLMTDEAAKWFVSDPYVYGLSQLRRIKRVEEAALLVESLRLAGEVQDDDMTVLRAWIGGAKDE